MSTHENSISRWARRGHVGELPCTFLFGRHRLLLRRLEPGDAGHLTEFFSSHTRETIRARYGYTLAALAPGEAEKRVSVDQLRDAALGAFERCDDVSRLVAVARYCLADDEQSAEMAFVVREDRRCLGVAGALLDALIAIASERKLRFLDALVQQDNGPMVAVFRRAGAILEGPDAAGCLHATIPLAQVRRERAAASPGTIDKPRVLRLHEAANRLWLRLENASAHLLGNYPLP